MEVFLAFPMCFLRPVLIWSVREQGFFQLTESMALGLVCQRYEVTIFLSENLNPKSICLDLEGG